jgi:hypothetical protein
MKDKPPIMGAWVVKKLTTGQAIGLFWHTQINAA